MIGMNDPQWDDGKVVCECCERVVDENHLKECKTGQEVCWNCCDEKGKCFECGEWFDFVDMKKDEDGWCCDECYKSIQESEAK